jgi:hypothetical protein
VQQVLAGAMLKWRDSVRTQRMLVPHGLPPHKSTGFVVGKNISCQRTPLLVTLTGCAH